VQLCPVLCYFTVHNLGQCADNGVALRLNIKTKFPSSTDGANGQILKLPKELIDGIGNQCDVNSLASLRAANKGLANFLDNAFFKRIKF
jgi:hypothetical protein